MTRQAGARLNQCELPLKFHSWGNWGKRHLLWWRKRRLIFIFITGWLGFLSRRFCGLFSFLWFLFLLLWFLWFLIRWNNKDAWVNIDFFYMNKQTTNVSQHWAGEKYEYISAVLEYIKQYISLKHIVLFHFHSTTWLWIKYKKFQMDIDGHMPKYPLSTSLTRSAATFFPQVACNARLTRITSIVMKKLSWVS